jgi:uncharacterized protein YkwD
MTMRTPRSRPSLLRTRLARLAVLTLVASCGDGEHDAGASPPLQQGPGAPPSGETPEAGTPAGAALAYELDAEERAFLSLINAHRARSGLGALQPSIALSRAAQFHSDDMAARDYFSHALADGRSYAESIQDSGYTARTAVGENIAGGNGDASSTFEQWKNSAGHNANMLDARYAVIGIGRAHGDGSRYGWYWTNTFGGAVDALLDASTGQDPGVP